MHTNPAAMNDFMKYIYMAPWIRFIPNVIGVVTGYFMYKINGRKIRLHWVSFEY